MAKRQHTTSPDIVEEIRQRLGPMQRELMALGLVVVAIITLLALLSITSGALSDGWANLLRQLFGWGAIPVTLGVGWIGISLLLGGMRSEPETSTTSLPGDDDGVSLRWDVVIGFELLFIGGLASLHLLFAGDDTLALARAGEGGGIVGWGIGVALTGLVGGIGTGIILVLLMVAAIGLLISASAGSPSLWLGRLRTISFPGRDSDRQLDEPMERPGLAQDILDAPPARRSKPRLTPEVKALPIRSQSDEPKRPPRRSKALPSLELLSLPSEHPAAKADVRYQAQIIEETLQGFGVPARIREINVGPAVTQFGVEPGYIERPGPDGEVKRQRVRVSKITSLSNDLALALAAAPIRIEAPVPGRPVVGIEVPNSKVSLVSLRGVLESDAYRKNKGVLPISLGRDVSGEAVVADLAAMPHLLIAGATGSGKSVCINAIITGLLCDHPPDELRFLMIDPKMVELTGYAGVPHLLTPVVVDTDQVVGALAWVTRMMDDRYHKFSEIGVRNVGGYNRKIARRSEEDKLPHIVVIIDELADLMMLAPDEIERYITRIAQMARATGIHMVIATQRPSVDVVTGLIKANFPARIAFAVTSQVDSRVILDGPGAERLLGKGDSLLMLPDSPKLRRLQGCFVSDQEIGRIVGFWKQEVGELQATVSRPWDSIMAEAGRDNLLDEAIELVTKAGRASTSHLQRRLGIGYPRAARLMDQLEEEGIVGPADGSHPREVLVDPVDWTDPDDDFEDDDLGDRF